MRKQRASERGYVSKVPAVLAACAGVAALAFAASPGTAAAKDQDNESSTQTPIKHVIVIVGENRTFDNVFGTYNPPHRQPLQHPLPHALFHPPRSPAPHF